MMGTFAQEIHTLPGTTFASPGERKGYDSEKHSALMSRGTEIADFRREGNFTALKSQIKKVASSQLGLPQFMGRF